jgi:hypothetical protein
MSALTPAQLQEWDKSGAVTVRTPLADDPAALARVQEAMLRAMPRPDHDGVEQPRRATNSNLSTEAEPALLAVVQMPFFEAAAQQCLRSRRVFYNGTGNAVSYPDARKEHAPACGGYPRSAPFAGEHVDWQCTLEDWESRENVTVSFFIWFADVTAVRAPLMIRPGSHRTIMAANSQNAITARAPRTFGLLSDADPLFHANGDGSDSVGRLSGSLHELLSAEASSPPSAPISLADLQPLQPIVAPAGFVTVTCTALVHALSFNCDIKPRMSMHLSFGRESGLTPMRVKTPKAASIAEHWERVRPMLRPERRHLCWQPGSVGGDSTAARM